MSSLLLRPRLGLPLALATATALVLGVLAVHPGARRGAGEAVGVQVVQAAPGKGATPVSPGRAAKGFTVAGRVDGLAPGVARPLRLTLTNPNPFAIVVDSLSVRVLDASPSCRATLLTVSGLSTPVRVPAKRSGVATLTATLSPSAPETCKNVDFPLRYSGTASKANPS